MKFEKLGQSGRARRGRLTLEHGVVETPMFMPVGTYGTVKGLLPRDIKEIKSQVILGNTFHVYLRPGLDVIREHGGLHEFMKWNNPKQCITVFQNLVMLGFTALRPAQRQLQGFLRFFMRRRVRRTFIKNHHNVRVQRVLNVH